MPPDTAPAATPPPTPDEHLAAAAALGQRAAEFPLAAPERQALFLEALVHLFQSAPAPAAPAPTTRPRRSAPASKDPDA